MPFTSVCISKSTHLCVLIVVTYSDHLHNLVAETHTQTQPRLGYAHEAEVPKVVVTNKTDAPSVDDVLRSLRTPTVQSYTFGEDNSASDENKMLTKQESKSTKEDNVNVNASAPLSVAFNRRCSLSDTEILHRQLSNERMWPTNRSFSTGTSSRIGSPHRVGSPRRSGSFDNFNFRALRKGSVAEEVLKEMQCDSSLLQSSLDNNVVYTNPGLSDSLDISGITLNDSLEKPFSTGDGTEDAWVQSSHRGSREVSQDAVGVDNSGLSIVSASESSSQVVQETAERPSILKTSRFGMYKDPYSDGSSSKVVKRVRFQDHPSTTEVQTYIAKQPSYLSQVPTFQMPISRTTPYKSQLSKSHPQTVGSHRYSSNSSAFSPKYESTTSSIPTPIVKRSSVSTLVDASELEKPHNASTKTPTDADINNLWSEIRSYFRESTTKPQNGLRLISLESSNYLTQGMDSRLPNATQKGLIRTQPVTHLSKNKQATPSRTDCMEQHIHKTDSRHCLSPVQITFNNSLLCNKEMKSSGM